VTEILAAFGASMSTLVFIIIVVLVVTLGRRLPR
jgi:hypothetical protein